MQRPFRRTRDSICESEGKKRATVAIVISTLRIVTALESRAKVVRTLVGQLGPTRAQLGCHRCDLSHDLERGRRHTRMKQFPAKK
jgi:hypothetical protein